MQIMSKVTTNLTCSKLEYDKLDKKCTCTEFKIFFSSSLVKFSAQSSHQENKKKKDYLFNNLNYSLWYRDITTLAVISDTWNIKTTVYCGCKNRQNKTRLSLDSPFRWKFLTSFIFHIVSLCF